MPVHDEVRLVVAVGRANGQKAVGSGHLSKNVVGGHEVKLRHVKAALGVEVELLVIWSTRRSGLDYLEHFPPGFPAIRGLPHRRGGGGRPVLGKSDYGDLAPVQRVDRDTGLGISQIGGVSCIVGDIYERNRRVVSLTYSAGEHG